jgi:hypothetical protein
MPTIRVRMQRLLAETGIHVDIYYRDEKKCLFCHDCRVAITFIYCSPLLFFSQINNFNDFLEYLQIYTIYLQIIYNTLTPNHNRRFQQLSNYLSQT